MIINYEYYQIFYYVAETKNITEAANHMFLSQSTVSRAIQNLERDLGCTLLIRSKQGLSLTEEGKYLHEHVKKAFSFISIVENHLNNVKELQSGVLRIGATELTLQHYLLPFIKDFERLYPKVHVEFDFTYPESATKLLNSGLLDIAVLTTPFEKNESINYTLLANCEQIVIAGSRYANLAKIPIDFAQLKKEPFILMKEGTSARSYANDLCQSQGISIFPKYETGSTPLIISMVEQNLGLGIVPRVFVEEKLDNGSLLEIKTTSALPNIQICALTSSIFHTSAVRDKFLSQLKTGDIHALLLI